MELEFISPMKEPQNTVEPNTYSEDRWGDTALHIATHLGCEETVAALLDQRVDVNARNEDGDTPLHFAQTAAIAKLLLANGASANIPNEPNQWRNGCFCGNQTALHVASDSGRAEVVSVLIQYGADVMAREENGKTALHRAGSAKIVDMLLRAGADVDAKEFIHSNTALHLASQSGLEEVVSILVQHRADINARERDGRTALHFAKTANIARYLLERGADIEATDRLGYTALHIASESGFNDVVSVLIERGADVNKRSDSVSFGPLAAAENHLAQIMLGCNFWRGCTALHLASEYGQDEIVSLLIKFKADVNAREISGKTALHRAESGRIARLLLEAGADIHATEYESFGGRTALHLATQNGCEELVHTLIQYGAYVNAQDGSGKMSLHYAKSERIANMLQENGADLVDDEPDDPNASHWTI